MSRLKLVARICNSQHSPSACLNEKTCQKKQYRWNAEDYAQHSSAQQSWVRELIGKLHLQGHEFVLDIGCGDGKVEIAGHLPNSDILGVDSQFRRIRFPLR